MIITLKWLPFASGIKSRYLAKKAAIIWTQALLFTSWPFYFTFPNSVMFFKHATLLAVSYISFYVFLSLSQIYIYIYLSTYIYIYITCLHITLIYVFTYEYISHIFIYNALIYIYKYMYVYRYMRTYIYSQKFQKSFNLVSWLSSLEKTSAHLFPSLCSLFTINMFIFTVTPLEYCGCC